MDKSLKYTIREQVYDLLKAAICAGEYKPGQWLQEKEVAEQFSVSRSPVREALHRLSADGLVIEIPNKGVFVRQFTPKDIEEIFDLRVMMENYAIDKICTTCSNEGQEQLKSCLKELIDSHHENDLEKYTQADTRLHNLIIHLSGNAFLDVAYERVHVMIERFRELSLSDPQRFDESLEEHRLVVESILTQNTACAQHINRLHLRLAKEQIVKYLEDSQKSE